MAAKEEEYSLETPQEHALMCEKHKLMPIDVTCEDCEEFICSKCAKEDHKDHDWITISTAATLRTRGLLKVMTKIEKEDIKQIDKQIQKASQQMDENKRRCESEVLKLQKHYSAMVKTLENIKKNHEKILRDSLESKNADVSEIKSSLKEKKKKVLQHVKSMKENGSTMTDIILIKTHRELTKLISTDEVEYKQKSDFLLRHDSGDINEAVLESMMGQMFDAQQITVTETGSFQWSDKPIAMLEAMNENTCLLKHVESQYVAQVNKCGSVSPVFSTDPLIPVGICQTKDGGLLVTLGNIESDFYQLNSDSRRLVRHVTLTGDVIREYEYQEDDQTRLLFTWPLRVTQNGNTDICIINRTSRTSAELVILSFSGSLKSVYPEQDQRKKVKLIDVVCDSYSNIIVSERSNSSVHLLSPEGKFMRYLLTQNQVNCPTVISLKKSTLWIGDYHGLVKVFQYKPYTKV